MHGNADACAVALPKRRREESLYPHDSCIFRGLILVLMLSEHSSAAGNWQQHLVADRSLTIAHKDSIPVSAPVIQERRLQNCLVLRGGEDEDENLEREGE